MILKGGLGSLNGCTGGMEFIGLSLKKVRGGMDVSEICGGGRGASGVGSDRNHGL